jgi:hypothetical protein
MAVPENSTIDEPADKRSPDEKVPEVDSTHLEYSAASGLSNDDAEFVRDYPAAEHKNVFRKVDLRLMPTLMSLYLIANIDRCVCILPADRT